MRVENRNDYLDSLLAGREADAGSGWLRALRMRAVERANELSVPTMRDEEWRFTDLSPLYKIPFRPASGAGNLEQSQLDAFTLPEAQIRLVFVDGRYSAELTRVAANDGVTVGNITDVSETSDAMLETHLAKLALIDNDAFAAVNTAFLRDGAVVHVARDRVVDAPIHILFIATRKDSAAYPRVLVVAETGAQCTLVEDFVSVAEGPYLTDAVSEIYVGGNARVSHRRISRSLHRSGSSATGITPPGRSHWVRAYPGITSRSCRRVRAPSSRSTAWL